jgi:hypothetical protein
LKIAIVTLVQKARSIAYMDILTAFLSGEFLLKRRANGGSVVLWRSIFVTALVYLLAVALKSLTDDGATFSFSFLELRREVNGTIPWAGALFAGVYAAFYARYSNQWSYLASTYNQIMAVKAEIGHRQATNNLALLSWQAGFISDAFTVHLDQKPIFKGVIEQFLNDQDIRSRVLKNFNGEEREEFIRRHLPFETTDSSIKEADR